MITLRPADARGRTRVDWLDSRHTFSFGEYHDPEQLGFRTLRVINDDRVAPGGGFATHSHRDMEIITYVLDGALEHQDSLGTGSVIRPGDVQRMSAGTGITHSEFNHSRTAPVHFLQIWIMPERRGLPPGYEQRTVPREDRRGRLRLIASRDGSDGAVTVHQASALYATLLTPGEQVVHHLASDRYGWLQVARGSVSLNGNNLAEGDGAAIMDEPEIAMAARADSELLFFELA